MFVLSVPLFLLKLEKAQIQTHQFSFLRQNQGGADMSFFFRQRMVWMSYIVIPAEFGQKILNASSYGI
jgi:hypothetical protein